MRVDRLKKSSVEDAEKELEAARVRLETLKKKTAESIWIEELGEFSAAWEKREAEMLNRLTASVPTGEAKKKVVRRKK